MPVGGAAFFRPAPGLDRCRAVSNRDKARFRWDRPAGYGVTHWTKIQERLDATMNMVGVKVRCALAKLDQAAPDPRRTAGIVLARICTSSHNDQLRTY